MYNEVLESPSIKINESWNYGCNKCLICNKNYKHSRTWFCDDNGLCKLKERIGHPSCFKLVNDIIKKGKELKELENKLMNI